MRYRTLAMVTFTVLAASACGSKNSPSDTVPASSPNDTSQLANPASVYCIDQGGTLEIVDEANGQVGYCTLPDGTRVEEWEYFRASSTTTPTSTP